LYLPDAFCDGGPRLASIQNALQLETPVKPLSAILAGLAGALFMAAPATDQVADVVEEKTGRRHRVHDWHSLPGIPEDAALPALGAMRQRGALATAQPLLDEAARLAASV